MLLQDVDLLINMRICETMVNYKERFSSFGVPTNDFKQEPGSNKEIKDFCETNFNIDFPMTEKVNVIGNNAHPFYLGR